MLSRFKSFVIQHYRWLLIAAVPSAMLIVFIWAAGWLTPARPQQDKIMSIMHNSGSTQHGFRRVHAKGVCLTGEFRPEVDGEITSLSSAALFRLDSVPIVGRFALGSGDAYHIDTPEMVRSLALRLLPDNGDEWRMAMNNPPILPMRDAKDAVALFATRQKMPETGEPDPQAFQRFTETHPWLNDAFSIVGKRTITAGFTDDTYYSQNAFLLVDNTGNQTAVRWRFEPEQDVKPAKTGSHDPNYLFKDLVDTIEDSPLRWTMIMTLAEPGDPVEDPSRLWSEDAREISAGTLIINRALSENGGPCTDITFDPTVLPQGIIPSDDPILAARSAGYMKSFELRGGEKRPDSVITSEFIQESRNEQ